MVADSSITRDAQFMTARTLRRSGEMARLRNLVGRLRHTALRAGVDIREVATLFARALALLDASLPERLCPLCKGGNPECLCGGRGWYSKRQEDDRAYYLANRRSNRPDGFNGLSAAQLLKRRNRLFRKRPTALQLTRQLEADLLRNECPT